MNEFVSQISFVPYFENRRYYKQYLDVETFELQDNKLSNLQQINFFIGENNSGKSRFIRTLMKWIQAPHESEKISPFFMNSQDNEIALGIQKFYKIDTFCENFHLQHTQDIELKDMRNIELKDMQNIEFKVNNFITWGKIYAQMQQELSDIKTNTNISPMDAENVIKIIETSGVDSENIPVDAIKSYLENPEKVFENENAKITLLKRYLDYYIIRFPCLYLPLLRGAKLLGEENKDVYLDRIIKDYNFAKNEVFTGLSIYKDLQDALLGSAKDRKLVAEFEQLLSKEFFNNEVVSLTVNKKNDFIGLQIGENSEERALHNLGDGIQALIVLLFPLYMRKNEDYYIFIEEPEMHLYPKWQRLFIKIIKKEFPKHQFFITTHSNVFINTANTSIYQVTRSRTNLISEVKHIIGNDKRGILSDLGYQPSDILHANFIIWVEGVSDVVYIRQFIKILDPQLVEYENYVFLHYGGCNNFEKYFSMEDEPREGQTKLKDINPNFWVIMDSDLEKSGQVLPPDFFKAKLKAFSNTWITEKREIENHIPKEIWEKAANNFYATNKLTMAVIELPDQAYDWDYDDRFPLDSSKKCPFECPSKQQYKDELKKNNSETPRLENVPSKTKICKEVVEIMTTEADLQKDTQLYTAMTNLVAAIRAANK